MPTETPSVRVVRSGLEESAHLLDIAVVDADGQIVASLGNPSREVFARSSMKPLQAAVSLSHASLDLSQREIAVMCGSHNAEPVHVETVRSLLAKAGVEEDALQCPSARPWDEESAIADPAERRINSNCSGKHAGMLAACMAQGWDTATYREPDHPLQQSILEAVRHATGVGNMAIGVDGCGIPVHGMPLHSMARIFALFSAPERWDGLAATADLVVRAMTSEPYMVAGRNRLDTALMGSHPGLMVKGGAEALVCAGILDAGLGVAVKVRDGSPRAAAPALIRALQILGVVADPAPNEITEFAEPPLLGGGKPVGSIRAAFDLTKH